MFGTLSSSPPQRGGTTDPLRSGVTRFWRSFRKVPDRGKRGSGDVAGEACKLGPSGKISHGNLQVGKCWKIAGGFLPGILPVVESSNPLGCEKTLGRVRALRTTHRNWLKIGKVKPVS